MREALRPRRQLKEFMSSCENRKWLNVGFGKIYVRKSKRIFENEMHSAFDVATIEVKEGRRGKGLFTNWLNTVEKFCDELNLPVYIENVHEERFRKFFEKQGYLPSHTWACYYKPPSSWHKPQAQALADPDGAAHEPS